MLRDEVKTPETGRQGPRELSFPEGSTCGPWTAATASPGILLEMQMLSPPPGHRVILIPMFENHHRG